MAQQPPAPEVYDDSPEAGFGPGTANIFRKMLDQSEVTRNDVKISNTGKNASRSTS